ncbi:zonadhesin-like [Bombina bombina]|uniref:zonadhesin-like n=1 Tax=Bombina bombina TaxID=8345 RepID=UPI00235A955B|nr:zonadhesin-like [Bombina bombina]XP_053546015.1 zonadhesin-like [Bombina bombina]
MLHNTVIILLLAMVLPLTYVKAESYPLKPEPKCGVNEQYYTECMPCPKHCGNKEIMCKIPCKPGCGCKPGYFMASSLSPQCIPEAKCEKCGKLEVYDECTAHCYDTCDGPVICTKICTSGCKCKNGYVNNNGSCILPSKCPKPTKGYIIP